MRFFLVVALFISMPSLGSVAQEKPEPTELDGKIEWVYDYEQGRIQAEKTDRPMFVVFRCER